MWGRGWEMKECWINVYKNWTGWGNEYNVWYGNCHARRLTFNNKENENNLLYRIHVKMK